MDKLFDVMKKIIEGSNHVNNYTSTCTRLIEDTDVDELNKLNQEFIKFASGYVELNSIFRTLMNEHNFNSINDIPDNEYLSGDDLVNLLNEFDSSVRSAQEGISKVAKILSSELNMINKIKAFKKGSTLDLKL